MNTCRSTLTNMKEVKSGNMEFLGLKFAPLRIPLERRLQTTAALCWILVILVGMASGWVVLACGIIFSSYLRYPFLLYGLWMYTDLGKNAEQGARRSAWARNWAWWHYFRDYFPVKLVKTAELPPDKNYLLATFPHGVLSSGSFSCFATDACGFNELYPGVNASLCTLYQHFCTPFLRELAYVLGNLPASENSLNYMLSHPAKGKAISLLVGGAQEAFFTKPGIYKIYLTKRKGFVRLALKNGAPLVPVFAFGEPEVYDQITAEEGSVLRKVQDFYKKLTGVAPILFNGRGIFQYSFGLVPRRSPIHVVVGKPIPVDKIENPTDEEINKLHTVFVEELKKLFNEEKIKYLEDKNTQLVIV